MYKPSSPSSLWRRSSTFRLQCNHIFERAYSRLQNKTALWPSCGLDILVSLKMITLQYRKARCHFINQYFAPFLKSKMQTIHKVIFLLLNSGPLVFHSKRNFVFCCNWSVLISDLSFCHKLQKYFAFIGWLLPEEQTNFFLLTLPCYYLKKNSTL